MADLVRRQCAVIVAGGDAVAHAAKAATASIPIVFATGEDPVKVGLVASLNRPGGNLTGISFYNSADLHSKQLEFLREVVPKAAVIGLLVNPTQAAAELQQRAAQVAARALGKQILIVNASSERDLDTAFATLAQQRAGALLIAGNVFFTGQRDRLVALAARYALHIPWREQVFLSWAGLRGAVPIVLATFPIVAGVPDSYRLLNIVFMLVVVFTWCRRPASARSRTHWGSCPANPPARSRSRPRHSTCSTRNFSR